MGTDSFLLNDEKRIILIINGIELFLDATIDLGLDFKAKLTDHRVEKGSNPSDHKRVEPDEIAITFVISNLPTTASFLGTAGDLFLDVINGNPIQAISDFFGQGMESASTSSYKKLKASLKSSDPVVIVTPFETFEDMQITGMSVPFRADLGGSLEATLKLKEFITEDSENGIISISALGKLLGGELLGSVIQGRAPDFGGLIQGGLETAGDFVNEQAGNLQGAVEGFPDYTRR